MVSGAPITCTLGPRRALARAMCLPENRHTSLSSVGNTRVSEPGVLGAAFTQTRRRFPHLGTTRVTPSGLPAAVPASRSLH